MPTKTLLRDRQGFTLIELIVVIVIIGILSATMLPKIMGAPSRARDAGRIRELDSIALALQQYYSDEGTFPISAAGDCLDGDADVGAELTDGGYLLQSDFPEDPTTSTTAGGKCNGGDAGKYFYKSLSKNGVAQNSYVLVADVENDATANAKNSCLTNTTLETMDRCIKDLTSANEGESKFGTGEEAIYVKLGD